LWFVGDVNETLLCLFGDTASVFCLLRRAGDTWSGLKSKGYVPSRKHSEPTAARTGLATTKTTRSSFPRSQTLWLRKEPKSAFTRTCTTGAPSRGLAGVLCPSTHCGTLTMITARFQRFARFRRVEAALHPALQSQFQCLRSQRRPELVPQLVGPVNGSSGLKWYLWKAKQLGKGSSRAGGRRRSSGSLRAPCKSTESGGRSSSK